jgi:hypothetical protein
MSVDVEDILKLAKGETVEMKDNEARETLVEHGKALEELNERLGSLEKGPHFTKHEEKKIVSKVIGESLPYFDRDGHLLAVGNWVKWQKEGVEYLYWTIIDLYWEMALPVAVLQQNGLQCIVPTREVMFLPWEVTVQINKGLTLGIPDEIKEQMKEADGLLDSVISKASAKFHAEIEQAIRKLIDQGVPAESIYIEYPQHPDKPGVLQARVCVKPRAFDMNGTALHVGDTVLLFFEFKEKDFPAEEQVHTEIRRIIGDNIIEYGNLGNCAISDVATVLYKRAEGESK